LAWSATSFQIAISCLMKLARACGELPTVCIASAPHPAYAGADVDARVCFHPSLGFKLLSDRQCPDAFAGDS
jgi:hypothetical protein